MRKYSVELTEDQMRLVANCLEDISRFASGQCRLDFVVEELLKGLEFDEQIKRRKEVEKHLEEIKKILLPSLSTNESKGYNGSELIGNTYQIYRTMLYKFALDSNGDNVYSSPPLPSGNMGTIKIENK